MLRTPVLLKLDRETSQDLRPNGRVQSTLVARASRVAHYTTADETHIAASLPASASLSLALRPFFQKYLTSLVLERA